MRRRYLKTFSTILNEMDAADVNHWFRLPVEATHNVPDYQKIIKHPMDVSTMRTKVRKSEYRSFKDFRVDIMRMFDNCILYNGRTTVYGQEALRLRDLANEKLIQAQEQLVAIENEEVCGHVDISPISLCPLLVPYCRSLGGTLWLHHLFFF